MKTTEQQMTEWADDTIHLRLDARSRTYVTLSRYHMERIAEAIETDNPAFIVDEANRMFATELMDWSMAHLIHLRTKERGIKVTARLLLQYESLDEMYHEIARSPIPK